MGHPHAGPRVDRGDQLAGAVADVEREVHVIDEDALVALGDVGLRGVDVVAAPFGVADVRGVLGAGAAVARVRDVEAIARRVLQHPVRVLVGQRGAPVDRVGVPVGPGAGVPRGARVEVGRVGAHAPVVVAHPLRPRRARGERVAVEVGFRRLREVDPALGAGGLCRGCAHGQHGGDNGSEQRRAERSEHSEVLPFGSWAVSLGDPWLCVPASRRVCLCRGVLGDDSLPGYESGAGAES